jgi:hypothetical protein
MNTLSSHLDLHQDIETIVGPYNFFVLSYLSI